MRERETAAGEKSLLTSSMGIRHSFALATCGSSAIAPAQKGSQRIPLATRIASVSTVMLFMAPSVLTTCPEEGEGE